MKKTTEKTLKKVDGRKNSGRHKLPLDIKKRQICVHIEGYIIDKYGGTEAFKKYIKDNIK